MAPKPPITRAGRSGWLGHRATRLKSLAVVGTVTLGFAGAALAAAGPASADPVFSFIQVGSDTTQYVMDAFANTVGGGVLGEYDAVNPATQIANETITPQLAGAVASQYSSCSFTRPNGSGGGYKAMSYAFTVGTASGTTTLGQNGTPPQAGCIQIDRSSSPPGSVSATAGAPGSSLTTGNFVYIPYAVDAMTYGTGPTTATSETIQCLAATTGCTNVVNGVGTITFTTTPTSIPQTLNLSKANLQTLYGSCQPVTVGGTTLNPGLTFSYSATSASPAVFTTSTASNLTANQEVTLSGGTAPGGFTNGTPYFVVSPTATTFELAATSGGTAIASTSTGSGSVVPLGTVDLYAPQAGSGTLAFWELTFGLTAPASCWHQTIVAGPGSGIAVEEHDGSAVASDPNGIEPVSIGRWVSGSTGVTKDLRHGIVLQSMTAADGTTVVPPLNGGGTINVGGCLTTGFNQATCFPLTRELYNVMNYFEVVSQTATGTNNQPFNSILSGLFAGASSEMCGSSFTISQQGFAAITAASNFPDNCGSTAAGLRTQMNNAATNG